MFDIGFSEVLLIFVIALVVLGPEKLPRLASQVGRWIGRARAMARQFREQLEEEVNLEQVRKAHEKPQKPATSSQPDAQPDVSSQGVQGTAATGSTSEAPSSGTPWDGAAQSGQTSGTDQHTSADGHPSDPSAPISTSDAVGAYRGPDPADFRADTFSHAHPTNEYGANPYTSNGAAPEPSSPSSAAASEPTESQTASEANVAAAQPSSQPDLDRRAGAGEAYAAHRPRDNTPGTDNHGN